MDPFQTALAEWLGRDGNTQASLGDKIGKSQVAVLRYAKGDRFPDADTARQIAEATGGAVPFDNWQSDFMAKAGLDAAA